MSAKMATISIELGKKNRKGERTVSFLIHVGTSKKRMSTGIHLDEADVTAGGKIKNLNICRMLEKKQRELQDRLYELQIEYMDKEVDAELIVNRMMSRPKELDFFQYAEEWIARPANKHKKNYKAMLNNFERFLGKRKLPFSLIDFRLLLGYENYLNNTKRAKSMYLASIRHLYREAMREYNTDYDCIIKNDPFMRYRCPRAKKNAGMRALTLEQLMKIYNYQGRAHSQAQVARDCFILSFCLMGMNSCDMYWVDTIEGGVLKYKRRKTTMRREDEAYIEVKVHPLLQDLMYRYSDNKRVWNFYHRYADEKAFNQHLNIGLKIVGKDLGIPNLTFYQARHTFATLSRNLMKFSKSDVDEALNHVGSYDIADIYIKKDFSIINENNAKLIEKVFSDHAKLLQTRSQNNNFLSYINKFVPPL